MRQSIGKSKFNLFLAFFLFLIISAFLPIYYSLQGVTDPFLFWHISFIQKFLYSTHFPLEDVVFSPRHIPGTMATLLCTSKISNITPKDLQFIPITGLILPIIYYTLCKKISNSEVYTFVITIVVISKLSPMTFFTVWTHAWGFLLFLVSIIIYFNLHNDKTAENIILVLIVFISVHFYSYTVEMWIITFFITINGLMLLIFFLYKDNRIKQKLTIYISLTFLIVFFMFNHVIYESYLAKGRLSSDLVQLSIEGFLIKYQNLLAPHSELKTIEEYAYSGDPNTILSLLGIAYFAIIISLVLFPEIILINRPRDYMQNLMREDKSNANILFFKIALLAVGAADIIMYATSGVLPFRYIHFIFPFLALIKLEHLNIKRIFKDFIILILLIIALSHTVLSIHEERLITNPSKYVDLENSANWFLNKSVEKKAIVDLRTGNKYLLEAVYQDAYFERVLINNLYYEFLVEYKYFNPDNCKYIILNNNIKKIQSIEWGEYAPLWRYSTEINNNIHIDKIYNDGKIWVFSLVHV